MKQLSLCVMVRLTNTKTMAAQVGANRIEMYEGCSRSFAEICKVNKEFCISVKRTDSHNSCFRWVLCG